MQRALAPARLAGPLASVLFTTASLVVARAQPGSLGPLLSLSFLVHAFASLHDGRFGGVRTATWLMMVAGWLVASAMGLFGFLMPMGQAAYWAATALTNVFAAVPVVGDRMAAWLWSNASLPDADSARLLALALLCLDVAAFAWNSLRGWRGRRVAAFALIVATIVCWIALPPLGAAPPAGFALTMATPAMILPDLVDLPLYSVLRASPSKLNGILIAAGSIGVWLIAPWLRAARIRRTLPGLAWLALCLLLACVWAALGAAGLRRPEGLVVPVARALVAAYFSWFALVFALGRRAKPPASVGPVEDVFT